ncbi:MAG: polyphosphate polymerase domain-containing protein [Anaerolineae bacterium]
MMRRYEYKIPCNPVYLPEVEAWIRLHPVHWRVSYPPRQVNNIYFDSPDLESLNANLSGVGRREKLRLRWYGPDHTRITDAHLELKCKEGHVGWKEITSFDGTLDLACAGWSGVMRVLRAGVEPRARHWLAQRPMPALINHYHRAYYETPDGSIRLTLDTQLGAFDQRFSRQANLERRVPRSEMLIIEIKTPVDDAAAHRLSNLLATLPVRINRFSKYLYGLSAAPDLENVMV